MSKRKLIVCVISPAMPNITLQLQSKLVKDSLSSVLTAAGFSVISAFDWQDDHVIVICGLDDYRELRAFDAQNGAKIVILANEADGLEMSTDEIASLSGVLTHELSVDALAQSLRLICVGGPRVPT